jgi:hypothetical protein
MALPPASRLFEFALPDSAMGGPCFALGVRIAVIAGRIADCVTLANKNLAKIANISARPVCAPRNYWEESRYLNQLPRLRLGLLYFDSMEATGWGGPGSASGGVAAAGGGITTAG